MKKIFSGIVLFFIIIVVAFNIFSAVNTSFYGYRILKVVTGSMMPYLNVGDFIIIKENSSYNVDDVITYVEDDHLITHRIIEVGNDYVITKGDANNIDDGKIEKSNIVGKLALRLTVISFFGYLFDLPLTWVLIFLIGAVIIMYRD